MIERHARAAEYLSRKARQRAEQRRYDTRVRWLTLIAFMPVLWIALRFAV